MLSTLADSIALNNIALLVIGLMVTVLALFGLVFTIWALIDIIRKPVQNKILWFIIVFFGVLPGALLYYFIGRKELNGGPGTQKSSRKVWLIIVAIIFVLLTIAGGLAKQFHAYTLTGNTVSMQPTLTGGQRIYTATDTSSLKRGDIIVFTAPDSVNATAPLVMRIVALADEHVVISNGKFTVYNQSHPNGFDPDGSYEQAGAVTPGSADVVVPKGDVYVLGDNRPNALDSRIFGPIPISSVKGRVLFHH